MFYDDKEIKMIIVPTNGAPRVEVADNASFWTLCLENSWASDLMARLGWVEDEAEWFKAKPLVDPLGCFVVIASRRDIESARKYSGPRQMTILRIANRCWFDLGHLLAEAAAFIAGPGKEFAQCFSGLREDPEGFALQVSDAGRFCEQFSRIRDTREFI